MKIEITQDQLDATIKALEFAQTRYEQDAVAIFGAMLSAVEQEPDETRVKQSQKLGWEWLDMADRTSELVDFFLHL